MEECSADGIENVVPLAYGKACPFCGKKQVITKKESKTRFTIKAKHFCPSMNGNCTFTLIYFLKSKSLKYKDHREGPAKS